MFTRCLLVFMVVAAAALSQDLSPRHWEPFSLNLLSGQIIVPPGGYYRKVFEIGNQSDQRLHVTFNAAGGSGNDIIVVVLPVSEYPNWANRHTTQLCYTTPGKQTTGKFEVTNFFKGVGTYVLIFDNRFSPLSAKYLEVQVDFTGSMKVFDEER